MQVESDAHRGARRPVGLRAISLCLAAAALLAGGCSEGSMAIYSRSEDALQNAGVKPEWVSPSGDSSKATYDAAVAKCKEEIKAATTDAIQQIPAARIDTCLIYKGWRQRSTSK